ncbi:hypothetical protein PVL29_001064 [Vitis rotundifolia]|uniref:Uncharacterized protein n=1 Tax=Vitis rotundifolia TaxID=103349 RepID=A0AA39E4N8_VITRO|nr:hypothetical protein PVL29_001064 [Vitis rotundifolia]
MFFRFALVTYRVQSELELPETYPLKPRLQFIKGGEPRGDTDIGGKGGRRRVGDGRNYGGINGRHEGSEVGVLRFQLVVLGCGGVRQWTSQDGDLLILGGLGESSIRSIMWAATSLSILVLQDGSPFSSYHETAGRTLLSFG